MQEEPNIRKDPYKEKFPFTTVKGAQYHTLPEIGPDGAMFTSSMIGGENAAAPSGAGLLDEYIGNYRLIRLLGHGGFASVYLGEHRYLKRLAAIKILRTVLNDQDKESFFEEARLLANLSHRHIVRVLEFAVAQQKMKAPGNSKGLMEYIPYLVMDFAPGDSLRASYPASTRLFADITVSYVKQIASALQYAHDKGVIHRDVKPENCLLSEQREVMLSDFGLALFAPSPGLLSTQQMTGTLPYAAPEQLRGKPGFASDQYSLGVMAYEWLCGQRPFVGEDIEIIMQHVSTPPPPLRERNPIISPAIEEVVLKALAKDPQERYPTVQAFARALEHANQWRDPDFSPYAHAAIRTPSSNPHPADGSLSSFAPYPEFESTGRYVQERYNDETSLEVYPESFKSVQWPLLKKRMASKYFTIASILLLILLMSVAAYGIFLFKTGRNITGSQITYEADASTNTLGGSASVYICPVCSDGHGVRYVGNGDGRNGILQFNNIQTNTSGSHVITIYYTNGDSSVRTSLLSINSGPPIMVTFPSTGNWITPHVGSVKITVNLKAGNNTLLFENVITWAVDFDKIVVS